MKRKDIAEAKDPDLRASPAALRRAAELARQTAIQTGTALIVVKDGKLARIPAEALGEINAMTPEKSSTTPFRSERVG